MNLGLVNFIGLLFLFQLTIIAQNKSEKIFVDGVCMMCENRIEKNGIKLKGVKMVDWNMDDRMLTVLYNENKVTIDEIHKHIASLGHDTMKEKAPEKAYNSLNACCKYRDEEVVKNHQ